MQGQFDSNWEWRCTVYIRPTEFCRHSLTIPDNHVASSSGSISVATFKVDKSPLGSELSWAFLRHAVRSTAYQSTGERGTNAGRLSS